MNSINNELIWNTSELFFNALETLWKKPSDKIKIYEYIFLGNSWKKNFQENFHVENFQRKKKHEKFWRNSIFQLFSRMLWKNFLKKISEFRNEILLVPFSNKIDYRNLQKQYKS